MRWEYRGVKRYVISDAVLCNTGIYILKFVLCQIAIIFCITNVVLMLYYIYVIAIYDGMYVRDMVNILY